MSKIYAYVYSNAASISFPQGTAFLLVLTAADTLEKAEKQSREFLASKLTPPTTAQNFVVLLRHEATMEELNIVSVPATQPPQVQFTEQNPTKELPEKPLTEDSFLNTLNLIRDEFAKTPSEKATLSRIMERVKQKYAAV